MTERDVTQGTAAVAEILHQLKQEVRRRGHSEETAPPVIRGDGAGLAHSNALNRLRATAQVNPHLPIAWPTWPKGFWPKAIAFTQKVTRRLLRWYINPIIEQQNQFNAASMRAVELLWEEVSRLSRAIEEKAQNSDRAAGRAE